MIGEKESSKGRELNKATVRVLEALSKFAADVSSYGVTELSQLLGMTKNMAYRALSTLVEQGYLVRDAESSRYQLGYRILELQSLHAIEPNFRTLCAPYLRRIQHLTGESVSLAVRSSDYCVLIDGIETQRPGTWRVRIGNVLPLFAPASGRVMLASDSDQDLEAYIARHRPLRDPRTSEVLAPEELRRDVQRVRERGYAKTMRGGLLPMLSVSFPVRDLDDALHGTISVGGPTDRFRPQFEAQLDELLGIVDELNSRTQLFSANVAGSETE